MQTDETARQQYLANRLTIKPEAFWRDLDQWPLYVGKKNLLRYMFLVQLLERTTRILGDVAEFGCWRGATTSLFAKMLPQSSPKVVHAFDNFAGFTALVQEEKDLRSNYQGSQDELEALLRLNGVREKVVLHVGDICHTTQEVTSVPSVSLALIDCDVYEPVAAALAWVHPRLSAGGLIAFDEYGDPAWPGETQAADEFLKKYGNHYTQESTPVAQPSLVLVRR